MVRIRSSELHSPFSVLARHSRRRAGDGRLRDARPFSSAPPLRSALLNLSGLSASRESQYFAKEHGVPRSEFSSQLQLIRSSEVDPFGAPGASRIAHIDARTSRLPKDPSRIIAKLARNEALLFKERNDARRELAAVTRLVTDLSTRYQARDQDARRLSWTVLFLVVGFVCPGWLRDPLEDAVARVQSYLPRPHSDNQPRAIEVPTSLAPTETRVVLATPTGKRALPLTPSQDPNTTVTSVTRTNDSSQRAWWVRLLWSSPT